VGLEAGLLLSAAWGSSLTFRCRIPRRGNPKDDKALWGDSRVTRRCRAAPGAWQDPELYKEEMERKRAAESRRKSFKRRENTYAEDKLRNEIAAPYKNNLIVYIVVGVGLAAVLFSFFPGLLENNVATSIASFPDEL